MSGPLALSRDVKLAPYNAWQVGGSAEYFCLPRTADELIAFQKWADGQHIETHMLGSGRNILISDQGLPGLTVCLKKLVPEEFTWQTFGCGPIFKNPPGVAAADLIRQSGLQGLQIGQAQVSLTDANFILNLGGAMAGDIWSLIQHVRRVVKEKQQIELRNEVVLLGQWSDVQGGVA
jgi:UDP-N-acetylenolpyruvoylglucosamine reductase